MILFNAFSQEGYISDGRNGCKSFTKQVTDRKMSWNGKCLNGYANGYGTLKVFQKDALYYTFIGSLKNGKLEGQGTFTGAKGDKYVGQWKNHNKEGQGTMTYASGHKYVGQWKNNNREGQGTMTYPDGSKKAGYWIKGNFNGISEVPLPCVISRDRYDEKNVYKQWDSGTSTEYYKISLYTIRSQVEPEKKYNILIIIDDYEHWDNTKNLYLNIYSTGDNEILEDTGIYGFTEDELINIFNKYSNKVETPKFGKKYDSIQKEIDNRVIYGSDADAIVRSFFKMAHSGQCPCDGFVYK